MASSRNKYTGGSSFDSIDWDAVDASVKRGYRVLPEGVYLATISQATLTRSSKSRNTYLELMLDITADSSGEPLNGGSVYDNITFVEKALFRCKQLAVAAGVEKALPADYGDDAIQAFGRKLVNEQVYVYLYIDEYQGKKKNRVRFYLSEDDAEELAEDAKELAEDADDDMRPSRRRRADNAVTSEEAFGSEARENISDEDEYEDEDEDDDDDDDDDAEDEYDAFDVISRPESAKAKAKAGAKTKAGAKSDPKGHGKSKTTPTPRPGARRR